MNNETISILCSIRDGWGTSGYTELTGLRALSAALQKVHKPDEILFGGLSGVYHNNIDIYRAVSENKEPRAIASIVFIDLSKPGLDIIDDILWVRTYLPSAVFVLHTNEEEYKRCKSELPEMWATAFEHYYKLYKHEKLNFNSDVREILDEARPTALRKRDTIRYHSLFLSYSHHDEGFTKRLYSDLQDQGVQCWFASHDLRPGSPIVRGIEEAIHLHEKFLLILSKDAVTSDWVQQEVEVALYKEVTSGKEILFPIRLDNTVLESDTLWAKRLRQRHIGDFTGWQDNTTYQRAFSTLLRHLKVIK